MESEENACVVCFKGVDIYSVGQCDHPVCHECSTRMRVLCRQNECPICRQDLPKVIFTKTIRPYSSLHNVNGFLIDKKFQIVFETEEEKKAYEKLLAHECPKCTKVFMTFSYLRDHVRRVHQLNYCDLCVDNLKIYSRERRCYSRSELTRHKKEGDPDNRSHRGHPLCEFCDTRYMDNDELYRHLRRDHLFCHFCDADGLHQYYSSYDFLRDHFRSEHFLCEEGDCVNEKFTAVFRSEIDLKAHRTTVHGRGLGKAGLKQARTLELEFTLAPRPRPNRTPRYREEESPCGGESYPGLSVSSGGGSHQGQQTPAAGAGAEECDERRRGGAAAAGGGAGGGGAATGGGGAAPELRREEDFPALSAGGGDQAAGGGGTSLSLRLTTPKQPNMAIHTSIHVNNPYFKPRVPTGNNYNRHFPALGNAAGGGSGGGGELGVTSVSWSACSGPPKRSGGEYRPPPGLPLPEEFPSLSASRTSTGTQSEPPQQTEAISSIGSGHHQRSGKQPVPAPHLPPPPSSAAASLAPPPASKAKKKKSKSSTSTSSSGAAKSNNTGGLGGNSSENHQAVSSLASRTTPGGFTSSALLTSSSSSGESKSKKNKKETKKSDNTTRQEKVLSGTESVENINNNNNYYNVENIIKSMSIETEKQKNHQNKQVEKSGGGVMGRIMGGEEFPRLGAPPGFSGPSSSSLPPPPTAETAPRWEIKKPPKPPPGLLSPPPGLSLPPPPPPGFSGLNGGFPPLIGCPPSDESNGYIAPSNFAKRNSTLVKLIGDTLIGETLDEFKDISVAFRNGSLSASEYYGHCRDMLGQANFRGIFPELLALLPDINKQQELWRTYKEEKKNTSHFSSLKKKVNSEKLEECATCGQILLTTDLRSHLAKHTTTRGPGGAAPSSAGGQSAHLASPWAKLNF